MIKSIINYIKEVLGGLKSLLKGMRVTGYYISHPKEIITQQYPENKDTLKMFDRFRGEVILLHDENNEHRCTGCTACEVACPNGSIEIISERVLNPWNFYYLVFKCASIKYANWRICHDLKV